MKVIFLHNRKFFLLYFLLLFNLKSICLEPFFLGFRGIFQFFQLLAWFFLTALSLTYCLNLKSYSCCFSLCILDSNLTAGHMCKLSFLVACLLELLFWCCNVLRDPLSLLSVIIALPSRNLQQATYQLKVDRVIFYLFRLCVLS